MNNSGRENDITYISSDNIYMEFEREGQQYVALTEDSSDSDEFNIMFAKCDIIDGSRILRNIEDINELDQVINEFNDRLLLVDGLEEGELYNG